ncbi:MAG: hypothetical protein DSY79_11030 [Chloroflexi bacterium]|nr:MAG: hypothetical protein DSY79_11030 [Chloroflexota bacterium]
MGFFDSILGLFKGGPGTAGDKGDKGDTGGPGIDAPGTQLIKLPVNFVLLTSEANVNFTLPVRLAMADVKAF